MPRSELQQLQERVKLLEDIINMLIRSDRYTFHKKIQILDGQNIQVGRGTGTKIGLSSSEKIGFYGVTPVDKPETVSDPSISTVSGSGADATINSNFSNQQTAITNLIDRLQEIGVIK